MKFNRIATFIFLLAVTIGYGQDTTEFFSKSDTFINTYVKDGRVDYKAIKSNPTSLNELVDIAKILWYIKTMQMSIKLFG